MGERNWAHISTGGTFEGLVTTLVFFEDANAALFGRPGPDGGQDVRSGDGNLVYQAKHHVAPTAAKAIADAKAEAAKIAKYRAPGHGRRAQWATVEAWRLCTNASFNPTDRKQWDDEVLPLFASLGLRADLWERANLDALLDKHPEVHRAYFEAESRVFLSLPEVTRANLDDAGPLARANRAGFRGRADELSVIRDFLESDARILLVHGPGGIGKTRMLLEGGQDASKLGFQVLWANTSSMELTGRWFDGVVRERPTVLLLDEPESETALRSIVEQLVVGGLESWRVLLGVRTPRDPVLKVVESPRVKQHVQTLELRQLPPVGARELCQELLADGPLRHMNPDWLSNAADAIAQRFDSHPIWLGMAVHVLEQTGDLEQLPDTAASLAGTYIDEIVRAQTDLPIEQLLRLLRWVALLQPVNREEQSTVESIAHATRLTTHSGVLVALRRLVDRRALKARGAQNRLVEIKPDVIRDHILRSWLTVDVGFGERPIQPSPDAMQLIDAVVDQVEQGNGGPRIKATIGSVARTEAILRTTEYPADLLGRFFDRLMERVPGLGASALRLLPDLVAPIAHVRPTEVVALSEAIRSTPTAPETHDTILGPRTISHDDAVLQLAWMVYGGAAGARTSVERSAVLGELAALAAAEAETATRLPRGLPNDGRRAHQLVGRVLEGGPQFWTRFDDEALQLVSASLGNASVDLHDEKQSGLIPMIEALISVERSQSWTEGYSVQFRHFAISPASDAWRIRAEVLAAVRERIESPDSSHEEKKLLWRLVAEAKSSAHRAAEHWTDEGPNPYLDDVHSTLVWALGSLDSRKPNLEELSAARHLWDWHLEYEEDDERKALAKALERLYAKDDLAAEIAPLVNTSPRQWDQRMPLAQAKAERLATAPSGAAVDEFIRRAREFLGDLNLHPVLHVAVALGDLAPTSQGIQEFVRSTIRQEETEPNILDFACVIASRWIWNRRKTEPEEAPALVERLMEQCGTDEARVQLLRRTYGFVPAPRAAGVPTPLEVDQLRSQRDLFLGCRREPAFLEAIGWTVEHDWEGLKDLVQAVLQGTAEDRRDWALKALVDAMYWGIRDAHDEGRPTPKDAGRWLLEQIMESGGSWRSAAQVTFELEKILRYTESPDVAWLADQLARPDVAAGTWTSSRRGQLSRHVAPLSATDAADSGMVDAISRLIELAVTSPPKIAPSLVAGVDPLGIVVPQIVAKRAATVSDPEEARRLAGLAGEYELGSTQWRTMATPLSSFASALVSKDRASIFYAMTDSGPSSWSSNIGEIPEHFRARVEAAEASLGSEQTPELVPFWEWHLSICRSDLDHEAERAKEERGE